MKLVKANYKISKYRKTTLQGYAEKVKAKVIREYVGGNRKRWGREGEGGKK